MRELVRFAVAGENRNLDWVDRKEYPFRSHYLTTEQGAKRRPMTGSAKQIHLSTKQAWIASSLRSSQ
jgi:hypothetical protein